MSDSRASKRKASEKRIIVSKRFKTDPNDEATKCLMADTLFGCTDVVSLMFSFLDVRQLLRFLCVSKEFKSLLTYDHVIRSTMLSGGFPLSNLERMVPPIRQRKIWIPSPIRLLRTVCGKRCESCDSPNRFVCDSFGVFLCKKCTNGSTNLMRRSKQWKEYLEAPRVNLGPRKGTTGSSRMYLMLTPTKDVIGNPIGPLVTLHDLENMASEKDESSSTPSDKLAAWMKACDDQQPQADAAVEAIVKALEDNRQDAVNRRAAILEEKKEGRDKLGAARRNKSHELMANLKRLLKDEDPDLIVQLNTIYWSDCDNQYTFHQGTGQGSVLYELLTPVLKAPSKYCAKKKLLQQVADQLALVMGEKKLMDIYIQRIIDHCDYPDTGNKVLMAGYQTKNGWQYHFCNPSIRGILKEPLSKPRDLTDEKVQHLADQVKTIVHRREPGEEVIQQLEERLKDLPFAADLKNRIWDLHYSWSWSFNETYVQDILYEPLSKPEDISEEQLEELEKQLRSTMERKKLVHDRMEQLLAPIAKPYPEWHATLEDWTWTSSNHICSFWDFRGRQMLGPETLRHVELMDDAEISELSNRLLTEIEKQLSP